jgi:hypothetical protein
MVKRGMNRSRIIHAFAELFNRSHADAKCILYAEATTLDNEELRAKAVKYANEHFGERTATAQRAGKTVSNAHQATYLLHKYAEFIRNIPRPSK